MASDELRAVWAELPPATPVTACYWSAPCPGPTVVDVGGGATVEDPIYLRTAWLTGDRVDVIPQEQSLTSCPDGPEGTVPG